MLRAEQLTIEPKSARATDQFAHAAPLDANRNPFASAAQGARLGRPAQTAFGELIRLIGLRTRVVVVLGKPGTGKTVLAGMAARACADMGLSVRRIERGDLLSEAASDTSDVLFVDEADSMSNDVLQSFLSASAAHPDRTTVFMCLPSCISRFSFSGTEAAVIELSPLSLLDARHYLTERGNSIGRPDLFTPQALDVVIDASRGVPRLLRSIAGLAYFNAAAEGASQIDAGHAEAAARMRNDLGPAKSAAPHALSAYSEPAEMDNDAGFPCADPDESVFETSAETAPAVAADKLHSDIEVVGWAEAAHDRRSLPVAKRLVALSLVLLAGAGVVSLMSGPSPRNNEPQRASRSAAIAVASPAETAPPQPSSEGATPTTAAPAQSATGADPAPAQSATSAESVPAHSTPESVAASPKSVSRTVAAKAEIENPNICALAELSRDPRALPVGGRCQGVQQRAQRAFPPQPAFGPAAYPPLPHAAETDRLQLQKSASPAADTAAAAQNTPVVTPVEPVRTTESGPAQAQAQNPIEVPPPPAALRSDPPAVATEKVQTQDLGEVARASGTQAQQKPDSPESDRIPVIIFGYRLW